ncbi:MAG: hypothetical protein JNG84_09675 [Archangium sp.]|nr:hypothetical protein [Archangium sp.]
MQLKRRLEQAEGDDARVHQLDARLALLTAESARIRENLTAVGKAGATAAVKELGARLLALEDELVKARATRDEAAAASESTRKAVASSR